MKFRGTQRTGLAFSSLTLAGATVAVGCRFGVPEVKAYDCYFLY